MIRASGILLLAASGNALFLKRSETGDHAGEWCFPGGKLEGSETVEEAALRETAEEVGPFPEGARAIWTRSVSAVASPDQPEEVDFTTFLQKIPEEFTPKLDAEHVGYAWAPLSQPPQPLHPGCQIALERFTMDELGIAVAIRDGRLTSPQRYENVSLFAMRITGTGTSYRKKLDEFVYRRPENYLTENFLARCNGLPVILEHPARATLDSKEFADRVVGTIMLPYIVGNEVWGIAKIYDDAAIQMMMEDPLSTSPSVVFRDPSVNSKMELENGSTLLIEGKPSLLDHLAICERGVWDKGEEPNGITARGDSAMTPEEIKKAADDKARADAATARKDEPAEREEMAERIKAKEEADKKKKDAEEADKKKSDADAGEKLDKVLECLDSLGKRMDGYDEEEKKRKDAMGDPEPVAADKSKKDAEEEEKVKNDKKRKDAEEEKAKADSADIKKRIADVEAKLPKLMSDEDHAKMADAQARADDVFSAFGQRAPRPLDGEMLLAYRRRVATKLKDHSKAWKEVDLAVAADSVLAIAETQIFADAMHAATHPTEITGNVLRAVTRPDSTGRQVTTFYGNTTFISALKRPSRRVAAINMRKGD